MKFVDFFHKTFNVNRKAKLVKPAGVLFIKKSLKCFIVLTENKLRVTHATKSCMKPINTRFIF